MLQRPSVNQIASAYTGRMPALQDQVEKDKQTNNGVPSDLRKLMALQDLLSDNQHMGIDQALKAPQNPATVSQSLQDRARQILGTKMAQAQQGNAIAQKQQEQMVNQGRPGPVPAGVSQPERQPEGIDQLASNVGDSYANGGIVAFTEGGYGKWLRDAIYGNESAVEKKRREDIDAAAQPEAKAEAAANAAASKRLNEERARNMAEVRNPTPEGDPRLLRAPKGESVSTAAQDAETDAAAAKQKPPRVNIAKPTDKPSIANLPTLPPELPTPAPGSPRAIMGEAMTLDPDAEMKRVLANREKMLGAPDTSQYQALINELRGQKEQLLKKPETGLDSVMEYFRDIAAGPTVGRSGKAGAIALEKQRLRDLENKKQANALSERMIEAAQKQQDVEYGYKKEGFTLSEAERARVWQERFNSAKAAGALDHEARKLAQDAVLDREKIAAQIKAAQIGAGARQGNLMDIAQALMLNDKTGKTTLPMALEQAAKYVGASAFAGQEVKSRKDYEAALQKLKEDYPLYMRQGNNKTAIAAQREYDAEKARIDTSYGVGGGAGLNSLPATNAGVKILSIEPSPK